jgi:tRNA threonylcarbamoyladenosine biosynthesis protein TsaE
VVAGTALRSRAAAETRAIGEALGAAARPGDVVALRGPLGAGKTQLAKGIARGLAVDEVVNSPTFVLMNEYPGRVRLFHVDAYRVEGAEAMAAGLIDERQADGVTVVEWADRVEPWLPLDRLEIAIEPIGGDERLIAWQATGPRASTLAAALEGLRSP